MKREYDLEVEIQIPGLGERNFSGDRKKNDQRLLKAHVTRHLKCTGCYIQTLQQPTNTQKTVHKASALLQEEHMCERLASYQPPNS